MTVSDSKFWCITAYFHTGPSPWRRRNFAQFRKQLRAPLLAVEMAPEGQFELDERCAEKVVRLQEADMMWQKERLLNLAIKSLPADCEYVAWLDCDITFCDHQWIAHTKAALETCDVLQPFRRVHFLTQDSSKSGRRSVEFHQESFAAYFRERSLKELVDTACERGPDSAAMGFAWAAKLSLMRDVGIYDANIVGGGDTAWIGMATNEPHLVADLHQMGPSHREHYLRWAQSRSPSLPLRIGYLDGEIDHFWHGSMASRRASERHYGLSLLDFDPVQDLEESPEGGWVWKRSNPDLHRFVSAYMSKRENQQTIESRKP